MIKNQWSIIWKDTISEELTNNRQKYSLRRMSHSGGKNGVGWIDLDATHIPDGLVA